MEVQTALACVLPGVIKTLRKHETIFLSTEGIGWEAILELRCLVLQLEELAREEGVTCD